MHELSPGRWAAEPAWPSANVALRSYALAAEGLVDQAPEERPLEIRGVQTAGVGPAGGGRAADHAEEDERWLCFDTAPATEEVDLFGNPWLELAFASDRPLALVAARLCDVAPDGTSTLVTRGILNLAHHASHEQPEALVPGRRYAARI